jgi:hypothetical protein
LLQVHPQLKTPFGQHERWPFHLELATFGFVMAHPSYGQVVLDASELFPFQHPHPFALPFLRYFSMQLLPILHQIH